MPLAGSRPYPNLGGTAVSCLTAMPMAGPILIEVVVIDLTR
jgi:hypothetical protein